MNVPLLLIVFNRPDLVALQLERLRSVRPARLYVASDGPRAHVAGERELVEACRAAVLDGVTWECKIFWKSESSNLGCGRGVSEAVTWFFQQVAAGIILEDDCCVQISFFDFCSELLKRYETNPAIGGVCADFKWISNSRPSNEYGFTRFPQIWGWASWARVWREYQFEISEADIAAIEPKLAMLPPAGQQYWRKTFQLVANGTVDTWDFQFAFMAMRHGFQFIHPMRNLVTNVGFDYRATHTRAIGDRTANLRTEEVTKPYVENAAYVDYDQYLAEEFFIKRSLARKAAERLWNLARLIGQPKR